MLLPPNPVIGSTCFNVQQETVGVSSQKSAGPSKPPAMDTEPPEPRSEAWKSWVPAAKAKADELGQVGLLLVEIMQDFGLFSGFLNGLSTTHNAWFLRLIQTAFWASPSLAGCQPIVAEANDTHLGVEEVAYTIAESSCFEKLGRKNLGFP